MQWQKKKMFYFEMMAGTYGDIYIFVVEKGI